MRPYLVNPGFAGIAVACLLISSSGYAQTTTTNPDGSTTTEETTTTEQKSGVPLVGPAGVTGAVRRHERREDRRMEEDIEDLRDAAGDRARVRR